MALSEILVHFLSFDQVFHNYSILLQETGPREANDRTKDDFGEVKFKLTCFEMRNLNLLRY